MQHLRIQRRLKNRSHITDMYGLQEVFNIKLDLQPTRLSYGNNEPTVG